MHRRANTCVYTHIWKNKHTYIHTIIHISAFHIVVMNGRKGYLHVCKFLYEDTKSNVHIFFCLLSIANTYVHNFSPCTFIFICCILLTHTIVHKHTGSWGYTHNVHKHLHIHPHHPYTKTKMQTKTNTHILTYGHICFHTLS